MSPGTRGMPCSLKVTCRGLLPLKAKVKPGGNEPSLAAVPGRNRFPDGSGGISSKWYVRRSLSNVARKPLSRAEEKSRA